LADVRLFTAEAGAKSNQGSTGGPDQSKDGGRVFGGIFTVIHAARLGERGGDSCKGDKNCHQE